MLRVSGVTTGKSGMVDVVLYEEGNYRNPIAIITDLEAAKLCLQLYNCLPDSLKATINEGIGNTVSEVLVKPVIRL